MPITTVPDNHFIENKSIYFGDKKISKENWSAISYFNKTNIEYLFKKKKLILKKNVIHLQVEFLQKKII